MFNFIKSLTFGLSLMLASTSLANPQWSYSQWGSWCNRVKANVDYLVEGLQEELNQTNLLWTDDIVDGLMKGLEGVTLQVNLESSPAVARLADTYLQIAKELRAEIRRSPINYSQLETNQMVGKFLEGALKEISREVLAFDSAYYLPYYYNNGRSSQGYQVQFQTMEREYLGFVSRSMGFINGQLADVVSYQDMEVRPRITGRGYLIAASKLVDYAVPEISKNLFSGAQTCSLATLSGYNQKIVNYLQKEAKSGDQSRESYLVSQFYLKINSAVKSAMGCN